MLTLLKDHQPIQVLLDQLVPRGNAGMDRIHLRDTIKVCVAITMVFRNISLKRSGKELKLENLNPLN